MAEDRAFAPPGRCHDRGACNRIAIAHNGLEAHFIARLKLSELPHFIAPQDGGTDKSTETRPVGSKDDRHVSGEIDRADGVGVVVNIRRMKARLSSIVALPFGLLANESNPRAGPCAIKFP